MGTMEEPHFPAVVNMDDASQISAIAETLFLGLGATIQVHRVMTPEDLGQATRRSSKGPRSTARTEGAHSSLSMLAGG
jgi:hypothetical protein